MAVQLRKGGRVNLTKDMGLKKALIGLGWDTNRYEGSAEFDLDLVIFECDQNKRCVDEGHMIFYRQLKDPEQAIKHSGDNRTGDGEGDDESAIIDLAKIAPNVANIIIAVTIYEAAARRQNFGLVDNAYIRMVNTETNQEVLRYDLGEEFSTQTSAIFAELYKMNNEWRFRAVGEGYEKELAALCHEYGIEVED